MAVILFTTLGRGSTKGVTNKLFLGLLIVGMIATVADIGNMQINALYKEGATGYRTLLFATYIIYLALRNIMSFVLVYFIYAITRTTYKLRAWKSRFFMGFPLWSLLGLLVTNPFHHLVFNITPDAGYHHGPMMFYLYMVSTAYAVYGIVYLIRYGGFVRKERFVSILVIYALQIAAVLAQSLIKVVRTEMFAMAIGELLMILIVLRPEEIVDSSVGMLTWKAYQNEIRKIALAKHPVQIAVVRISNATQVRAFLGEEKYNAYLKRLAAQMEKSARENKVRAEFYYEAPSNIYIVFDHKVSEYDAYARMPIIFNSIYEKMKTAQTIGMEIETKILVVHYPADIENAEEMLRLGHNFTELMPYYQDVVAAAEIIHTRQYEIEKNLEEVLHNAIENELFEMYYQPIYSVKEDKFTSAEALIRLNDKEFGMISPAYFIPAAEKNGTIQGIGDFVLESVFKFVAEKDVASLGLEYVEINLSIAQCMRKDFPKRIADLQKKYNVKPSQINFEIVETTNNVAGDEADKNIREIALMGYSFSLDDYGTGYSNIRRISSLPLSIIKIDKSLVDVIDTPDGRSILKNAIRMMKDINKEVVIEGVEQSEVAQDVIDMGCDYIQGYYFSKPLPVKRFVSFVLEHNGSSTPLKNLKPDTEN